MTPTPVTERPAARDGTTYSRIWKCVATPGVKSSVTELLGGDIASVCGSSFIRGVCAVVFVIADAHVRTGDVAVDDGGIEAASAAISAGLAMSSIGERSSNDEKACHSMFMAASDMSGAVVAVGIELGGRTGAVAFAERK